MTSSQGDFSSRREHSDDHRQNRDGSRHDNRSAGSGGNRANSSGQGKSYSGSSRSKGNSDFSSSNRQGQRRDNSGRENLGNEDRRRDSGREDRYQDDRPRRDNVSKQYRASGADKPRYSKSHGDQSRSGYRPDDRRDSRSPQNDRYRSEGRNADSRGGERSRYDRDERRHGAGEDRRTNPQYGNRRDDRGYRQDDRRDNRSRDNDRGNVRREGQSFDRKDSRGRDFDRGQQRDDRYARPSHRSDDPGRDSRGRDGDRDRGPRRDDARGGYSKGQRDDRRPAYGARQDDRGPRRDDRRAAPFVGGRDDNRGRKYEGGRGGEDRRDRRTEEPEIIPHGLEARPNEPSLPEDISLEDLPFSVKAELRGLPKDLAATVAGHLVMAGNLIDSDPELAFEHAMAARRRAARLPVVREAAAETAYAAEEYTTALTEYRALYRMTGDQNWLPVLADTERALGRPQAALKLIREANLSGMDPAYRVELIIIEAGARADLGQRAEALRLLSSRIQATQGPRRAAARIRYVYADLLEQEGQADAAQQWFAAAARYDEDGELDADERAAALAGVKIEFDEGEDDGELVD